jgi:hypothetical protein
MIAAVSPDILPAPGPWWSSKIWWFPIHSNRCKIRVLSGETNKQWNSWLPCIGCLLSTLQSRIWCAPQAEQFITSPLSAIKFSKLGSEDNFYLNEMKVCNAMRFPLVQTSKHFTGRFLDHRLYFHQESSFKQWACCFQSELKWFPKKASSFS